MKKLILASSVVLVSFPAFAVTLNCTNQAKDFSIEIGTLGQAHQVAQVELMNKLGYVADFDGNFLAAQPSAPGDTSTHLKATRIDPAFDLDNALDLTLAAFDSKQSENVALKVSGHATSLGFQGSDMAFSCTISLPDPQQAVYWQLKDCLVQPAGVAEPAQISDSDVIGKLTKNIVNLQNSCINSGLISADLPSIVLPAIDNLRLSKFRVSSYASYIAQLVSAKVEKTK